MSNSGACQTALDGSAASGRLQWGVQQQPLTSPTGNAWRKWRWRQTLVVKLSLPGTPDVQGECAPLPGYSRESLGDCVRALAAITPEQLERWAARPGVGALGAELADWAGPASARYAIELALLQRLAHCAQQPLWQLLAAELSGLMCEAECARRPDPGSRTPKPYSSEVWSAVRSSPRVPLSALLSPPAENHSPGNAIRAVLGQSRQRMAEGLACLKFKIGPEARLQQQLECLQQLRAEIGPEVDLRLDANGSLPEHQPDEVVCAALSRIRPGFIEEPQALVSPATLDRWPCPLALDETLAQNPRLAEATLSTGRVGALVLKPTTLGGLWPALVWAARGARHGASGVVSQTFENASGFAGCAELALALSGCGGHEAAGLYPLGHQRGLLQRRRSADAVTTKPAGAPETDAEVDGSTLREETGSASRAVPDSIAEREGSSPHTQPAIAAIRSTGEPGLSAQWSDARSDE